MNDALKSAWGGEKERDGNGRRMGVRDTKRQRADEYSLQCT